MYLLAPPWTRSKSKDLTSSSVIVVVVRNRRGIGHLAVVSDVEVKSMVQNEDGSEKSRGGIRVAEMVVKWKKINRVKRVRVV